MGAANSKWTRKKESLEDFLPLIAAIRNGDAEEVSAIVTQNPRLTREPVDSHGWTPLHHACHEGKLDMVRFMVDRDRGQRVGEEEEEPAYNIKDKDGWSPVFRTCSDEIIEHLLQYDDLQIFDKDGYPLDYLMDGLVCAIESGDMRRVAGWITKHPKLLR